jgi:phage shock protein A
MITDHQQLEVIQEQLRRLELVLAELRRSVSEIEFRSQAPPVIEHIRRLRNEIDTYLGINEAESMP